MSGNITRNGTRLSYHVYQIYEAGTDPSICEVYFTLWNEVRLVTTLLSNNNPLKCDCIISAVHIRLSYMHRGVTRLGGAWGKKQVWCSHVRTWGFSEANLLCWRKYLWYFLEISAPLAVIRRPYKDLVPGELCPLAPPSLHPCICNYVADALKLI